MKRFRRTLSIFILFLLAVRVPVAAESELAGRYMTLRDNRGRVIARTSHRIMIGDEYLNSSNYLYKVVRLQKNTAIVKLVKKEKLSASVFSWFQDVWKLDFLRGEVKQRGPIAIYHTHSDESYNVGDGTSSIKGNGGIFQVGDALTSAFEKNGVPVVHSKTPHDPHDAMAYDRSRRTAIQLLRNRPTTLLDVHRDAVPAYEYTKEIGKESVTKVQLVVGRQNPNFPANNDFARQIKATVDRKYPGLVKGIFYGQGKYNQDLGPRSILLEFGSNTNSKVAAERGAQVFAAAAKDVLYGNTGSRMINRGSARGAFWIIAALIGGVGLFLFLNRSGLESIGKEFTGAIGEEESVAEPKQDEAPNREHDGESS
ncbi:MAG: stage II sporulation protein P [Bacillota bacterium]